MSAGIHAIAARQAVLRAAVASVDEPSDATRADLADAVAAMRRAEAIAPRFTCATCGLGVIVANGQTIRGCSHVDAAVLARCRTEARLVTSVAV